MRGTSSGHRRSSRRDRYQAALASAASFGVGAGLPLVVALLAPATQLLWWVPATSLAFLVALGVLAARAGGSSVVLGAWRVAIWGVLAMAITAGAGALLGTVA